MYFPCTYSTCFSQPWLFMYFPDSTLRDVSAQVRAECNSYARALHVIIEATSFLAPPTRRRPSHTESHLADHTNRGHTWPAPVSKKYSRWRLFSRWWFLQECSVLHSIFVRTVGVVLVCMLKEMSKGTTNTCIGKQHVCFHHICRETTVNFEDARQTVQD